MILTRAHGRKIASLALLAGAVAILPACTSIRENRGYIVDSTLVNAIQPGLDNQRSVEATLGRPTFTSQYGDPIWYYVSSTTARKPFVRPQIEAHRVLAIRFDPTGNVLAADTTGIDQVVYLSPESDKTPTLGRERGFLEDLFGNIGVVGAPGAAGGAPRGPGG